LSISSIFLLIASSVSGIFSSATGSLFSSLSLFIGVSLESCSHSAKECVSLLLKSNGLPIFSFSSVFSGIKVSSLEVVSSCCTVSIVSSTTLIEFFMDSSSLSVTGVVCCSGIAGFSDSRSSTALIDLFIDSSSLFTGS